MELASEEEGGSRKILHPITPLPSQLLDAKGAKGKLAPPPPKPGKGAALGHHHAAHTARAVSIPAVPQQKCAGRQRLTGWCGRTNRSTGCKVDARQGALQLPCMSR